MSNLDDVRAKFRRACEHDEAARAMLSDWSDRKPYGVFASHEADGWLVLRLSEIHPAPIDLSLMWADFIHNLRCVLDHIVCSLIETNGVSVSDWNGFPVTRDSGNWKSAVGHNLAGFPREWVRVVKEFQPFTYGADFAKHPLYWLHRLDIDSKHRLLIPVAVNRMQFSPSIELSRPECIGDWIEEEPATFAPGKPIDGAELVRYRAHSEDGDLRILKVAEGEGAVRLFLGTGDNPSGDPRPVGPIPNLVVFVGTVIDALAPAFSP